jgi:hypothetical protein
VKEMVMRQEMINPANIPSPPREGTGDACIFLAFGRSYSFFISDTLIITGIAVNVITKANIVASKMISIRSL